MRSRLEKKDGDEPRKLAQAERASRHRDQELRLLGSRSQESWSLPTH